MCFALNSYRYQLEGGSIKGDGKFYGPLGPDTKMSLVRCLWPLESFASPPAPRCCVGSSTHTIVLIQMCAYTLYLLYAEQGTGDDIGAASAAVLSKPAEHAGKTLWQGSRRTLWTSCKRSLIQLCTITDKIRNRQIGNATHDYRRVRVCYTSLFTLV